MFVRCDEDVDCAAFFDAFSEKAGADALALATIAIVADDADSQVDFAGVCLQARCDRVEAWRQFAHDAGELIGGDLVRGEVD